jgi:hypothetical protein
MQAIQQSKGYSLPYLPFFSSNEGFAVVIEVIIEVFVFHFSVLLWFLLMIVRKYQIKLVKHMIWQYQSIFD